MHPIDILLIIADLNTKPLLRERAWYLLALIGIRDMADGYAVVGQSQLDEVRARIAVKLQFRRLQHRSGTYPEPSVLATALRIAVVLHELQGVAASDQGSALIQAAWFSVFEHCMRCILFVIILLCPILLQGYEPYETAAHAALVELWFIRLVEGLMEQPVLGFSAIIVVILVPWIIILLICCRTTHLRVTLTHESQTRVDAHDAQPEAATETDQTVNDDIDDGDDAQVHNAIGGASSSGELPQDLQDRLHACMHERISRPAAAAKAAAAAAASTSIQTSEDDYPRSGAVNTQPENPTWVIAKPDAKSKPKRIRNRRPPDAEVHIYTSMRTGSKYHMRRQCKDLNRADEIACIGLAEAIIRGYIPYSVGAGGT